MYNDQRPPNTSIRHRKSSSKIKMVEVLENTRTRYCQQCEAMGELEEKKA